MKKFLLLLILFIFIAQISKAQYVTIPDSAFRVYLKTKYPSCFNGSNMMDTTCTSVLSAGTINVANKNISSLEGIQYFKGLLFLYCNNNKLTALPPLPQT